MAPTITGTGMESLTGSEFGFTLSRGNHYLSEAIMERLPENGFPTHGDDSLIINIMQIVRNG